MSMIKTDFFENKPLSQQVQDVSRLYLIRQSLLDVLRDTPEIVAQYPQADIQGVRQYLLDTTVHYSEGRNLSFDKKNYSVTELNKAYTYASVAQKIKYLVYRYRFNHYPRHHIIGDFPIVLCIEPASICNLRCVMCFQCDESFVGNKNNMGMMSLDTFKRIIDEGSQYHLSSIVLASRGEPLLNKEIYSMIRYAKEKGIIDIKLNTNATALTEKAAHALLSSGLDTLVFSVDSADKEQFEKIRVGANFDKIVENIKRFKLIRESHYPDVTLRTRVTMVKVNEQIDVQKAKAFWSDMVDEFGCRNLVERLDIYDNDIGVTERPCSLLWERLYVWFNGQVNVCDEDYKSILCPGWLKDKTIHEIWQSEQLNKMREKHLTGQKNSYSPCDHCPGF